MAAHPQRLTVTRRGWALARPFTTPHGVQTPADADGALARVERPIALCADEPNASFADLGRRLSAGCKSSARGGSRICGLMAYEICQVVSRAQV
jgi:hypothetical protein